MLRQLEVWVGLSLLLVVLGDLGLPLVEEEVAFLQLPEQSDFRPAFAS